MPPRAKPKPCPRCGKPIRPEAVKCWFCGGVFDTRPCPHCDSPVKHGFDVCWFCGGDMPAGEQATSAPAVEQLVKTEAIQTKPVASPGPELPPSSVTPSARKCPNCGQELPLAARQCRTCGEPLETNRSQRYWDDRPILRPHRGGNLLPLALVSLFCCGIILGPIVAVVATNDLSAMKEGRMDPEGDGTTRAAQVIAIIATVLHGILLLLRISAKYL